MKRTENHRGRFYDESGKKYPSVTTILSCVGKPGLANWYGKMERELVIEEAANVYEGIIRDLANPSSKLAFITRLQTVVGKKLAGFREFRKAGEIGTEVHSFIEWTLRAELCQKMTKPCPEIGPEAKLAVDAWKEWRSSVNLRPILVESYVVSRKHGYAGTMDFLCAEVDGVQTLLDWKTGKRVYYEAHLQNAAYRVAAREMGLADAKEGLIVRLPKMKKELFEAPIPARDEAKCFEVFVAVKKLWEDMQEQDKWLKEQDSKSAVPEDLAPLLQASIEARQ